jgi:hypothetical protein
LKVFFKFTVSKALEKSRSARMITNLRSISMKMSSVILRRAVVVLCPGLKPNWKGFESPFSLQKVTIWSFTFAIGTNKVRQWWQNQRKEEVNEFQRNSIKANTWLNQPYGTLYVGKRHSAKCEKSNSFVVDDGNTGARKINTGV